MALDVQCGCASKIEIVRTNSLTGEVTGVFPQTNIWTDAGLARISGYVTGNSDVRWPSRLHYGSGAHVAPHNGVKRLANRLGHGVWGGSSNATYPDLDTVLVTRTASITVGARGVAWELSELGLSMDAWPEGPVDLDTYSLTKIGGVPAPIPVAAIEILTITYTVQIQYPRKTQFVTFPFENGPETSAELIIPHSGTPSTISPYIRPSRFIAWSSTYYTPSRHENGGAVFDDSKANGEITRCGNDTPLKGVTYMIYFTPPITKNNTQELTITSKWTFTNGTYREV